MDGPLAFGHSVKNKNHLLAFSNILTFAVAGTGNSQLKQYINNFDPKCISDFPCLPDLSILVMPGQHDHDDFNCGPTFEACYKQHCLTVVTAIGELNFSRYSLIDFFFQNVSSPKKRSPKGGLQKELSKKRSPKGAFQKELSKGSSPKGSFQKELFKRSSPKRALQKELFKRSSSKGALQKELSKRSSPKEPCQKGAPKIELSK